MRAILLLGLAVLALPTAAAGAAFEATFDAPASLDGGLDATGLQWAILLFHGGQAPAFDVQAEAGAQAVNHTVLYASPLADRPAQVALPNQTQPLPEAVQGRLDALPGWSSLVLRADRVRVTATGLALAAPSAAGDTAQRFLPPVARPDTALRAQAFQAGAGAALSLAPNGTASSLAFHLEASGVRRIEWHNAAFACASHGACPGSATGLAGPLAAQTYMELLANGGTLSGGGSAVAIATGGPVLDATLAGALRLPGAHLAGTCGATACPDPAGRTLLAHGNATFAGLAPAGPRRLHAQVTGSFREAAYDETSAAAFTVPRAATVAAAVGALALLLALLAKPLLALFAHSERPPPLQHPRRRALFELVQQEPGLSFRALQRRLGWPTGPLQAHVARLLAARLVVAQPYRNTVRYFENHGRYRDTWQGVAVLRDPEAERLHAWLLAHPAAGQGAVVAEAAAWGWKRSRALRRLKGLEEAGLVERRRDGRTVRYVLRGPQAPAQSVPEGPPAHPALAPRAGGAPNQVS
ncbi:MAG: hypothetical protein QOI63_1988 [Thermoplasmata archaeon]|nr:hypothetical protein [Thermoplasmata archaeon]